VASASQVTHTEKPKEFTPSFVIIPPKIVIAASVLRLWCTQMKLRPFDMERWQSTWENQVEYNLSESGVHALKVNELIGTDYQEFLGQYLGYGQTNGTEELRTSVAAMYPDAVAGDILITNGSAEANFVTLWSFLERGAQAVIMLPNYMQVWGLAKTLQANVKSFRLRETQSEWSPDVRALKRAVSRRTKLIAICNPNNPTGATMQEDIIEEICETAKRVSAWILSDEVYRGAELDGSATPSFWGKYDKVIVNGGLSKAYGLPGLRIGWIATSKDLAAKLWSYHDYTTIAPSPLSDYLARRVLEPEMRAKILARTRGILRKNLPIVKAWINKSSGKFSFIPPRAGAIAYVKYNLKINSSKFAERLLREKSTLVVPGDHFGMDGYLRIGYGPPEEYLTAGLTRIDELVEKLT
jgi:aspartate/methionine/tyrosine aminotransferase